MKALISLGVFAILLSSYVSAVPLSPIFQITTSLDDLGFYAINGVQVQSVAVSTDGKIWVSAAFQARVDPDLNTSGSVLLRYKPDGNLDETFHANGKLLGTSGALTALPAGRMLVGAKIINADGSTDPSFNGAFLRDRRIVQTDGRIISFGSDLRRCLPDGSLDHSFNGSGIIALNSGAADAVLQSDGRIVVFLGDHSVRRFNTDGTVDLGFGDEGTVPSLPGSSSYSFFALAPSGKFVLAGTSTQLGTPNSDFAVTRYNADGSLDTSFGISGIKTVDAVAPAGIAIPPYADGFSSDETFGLYVQADDSIIVGGAASQRWCTMLRLTPTGALDPFFGGSEGRILVPNPGLDEIYLEAFVQGDGYKFFAAGRTRASGSVGQGPDHIALFGFSGGYPSPQLMTDSVFTFDPVTEGSSQTKTLIIRNEGNADLTNIVVTRESAGNAADFALGTLSAAVIAPGGTAGLPVTFSPGGPGQRTARLSIESNNPYANPVRIDLSGRQATVLEAWRQEHFHSPYSTNDGADLNDADGDGLVNLMEFATGSHPREYSPPVGVVVKNGNVLEFTYTRRKAALAEVTFIREYSETLSGIWSRAGSTVETILTDGDIQTVRVNNPAGINGKRFVRLRVTRL